VSAVGESRAPRLGLLAALVVALAAGGFALGRSGRTSQAEAMAAQKQAMARTYAVAFRSAYATGKAAGFEAGLLEGAATARVQGTRAGLLRVAEREERRAAELGRRSGRAR
jgi:catalase (peroxidase I)